MKGDLARPLHLHIYTKGAAVSDKRAGDRSFLKFISTKRVTKGTEKNQKYQKG